MRFSLFVLLVWVSLGLLPLRSLEAASSRCVPERIVTGPGASALEVFAAREIHRYVYLCTGERLPLVETADLTQLREDAIVVGTKGQAMLTAAVDGMIRARLSGLGFEQYRLELVEVGKRRHCLVVGGDGVGTLYAAYRLAEWFGARFYLHGDVLPDVHRRLEISDLDESAAPLFALRGIQPFHDFPEGPDWWNLDDYLGVLSQLPKLRMNFFGLHTYPEGAPNAEPTVWIGQTEDMDEQGRVGFSYPSSYMNTLRGNWGYAAKVTSRYSFGAAELFDRDAYGGDVMGDSLPQPATPEACNAVFDRTAELLRAAFEHARRLGVKTCVGTETPLTVPKAVQERLRAAGRNPADPATIRELYTGMFRRIERAYPLDYYWFWTPEGWTWEGTKDEQVKRALDDLQAAIAVHQEIRPPFQLATCGWVLGPQQDRALFDQVLPKHVAVSCINREVGKTPVDKGFAEVSGRGKWAIPWMEDDPALTSPQLWVGRMRRDAADARRYGCDGLMGIHWRTRVLGPAVSALAQAAWNQEPWNIPDAQPAPVKTAGPEGGAVADYPNNPIAGTEEDRIYQSVRYNLSAYRLPVANGACKVTLKFCEPHYAETGKRVFDVILQGKTVLSNLDIFGRVGKDRALDLVYENAVVTNGWLDIEFAPRVEFPSLAALVVEAPNATHRVNCGGAAWQGYAADWPVVNVPPTFPPTDDFYEDWATHEFGPQVGPLAAKIFIRMDGRLPRPSDWVDGPGGIRPDARPWLQVEREYGFVDEFALLRPQVKGAGTEARFDYWLETFCYLRAMGHVNCLWAEFNRAFEAVKLEKDTDRQRRIARERALPIRRQLVAAVGELYRHLLASVSNPGELGTVMNWEQHNLPGLLEKPGVELAKLLGEPLPADAQPASSYRGPARLVVPTSRTSLYPEDALPVRILVLAEPHQIPVETALYWRPLGKGKYSAERARHVARGVYEATLPTPPADAIALEYYVQTKPARGAVLRYPATAPAQNLTLTIWPAAAR